MKSPDTDDASPKLARRTKRSYVACGRCHSQKTKCSGGKPCRGCVRSGRAAECTFPNRERKITVLESYIEKLQAENAELKRATSQSKIDPALISSPLDTQRQSGETPPGVDVCQDDDEAASTEVADPLLEDRLTTQNNCVSSRPVYVGGAACTTFATRLGFHIRGNNQPTLPCATPILKHPGLQRSMKCEVTLPSRAYTQILIQVVLRFVGKDYHFLRRRSYFEQVDQIYQNPGGAGQMALCKLFVVLALGELYLKKTCSVEGGERVIPGTKFFVQAVSLLQDQFEEPDISYIETLLLLSFYSHALNRKNTAYTYAGLALRLSLTLGLHRNITYDPGTHPAEIENRRRVWWTVYTFDRLCSSKLGHAVMIRDEDIDAPLPSSEAQPGSGGGLSAAAAGGTGGREAGGGAAGAAALEDFVDARQLIANVGLSRITGSILNLIYGRPTQQRPGDFVRNVHTILNSLRQWDVNLPAELRLDHRRFPSYGSRPVASLRLHFNQCIILTTRPVLLHVFNRHINRNRNRNKHQHQHQQQSPQSPQSAASSSAASASSSTKPLSPMTVALSEACICAARATANLLGQLWADGSIATFGFFDAHYAFSSTVVLIMSTLLLGDGDGDYDGSGGGGGVGVGNAAAAAGDREAIALSRALLQSMVDDGNLPAREFHGRLEVLQRDIDEYLEQQQQQQHRQQQQQAHHIKYGPGGGAGAAAAAAAAPDSLPPPAPAAAASASGGYATRTGEAFATSYVPHHRDGTPQLTAGAGGGSSVCRMPGNSPGGGGGEQMAAAAPLDAPFIQDFLGNFDTNWSPGVLDFSNDEEVPWSLFWETADPV